MHVTLLFHETTLLLKSITQSLDKHCRDFFWGTMDQQRCLHTMAWKKLCRPREVGGLGIPDLSDMNEALLAKRPWKLTQSQRTEPTMNVLMAKYGGWQSLVKGEMKINSSSIWRSIGKAVRWIVRGIRWEVGDGNTILFWHDIWLGEEPLRTRAVQEIPREQWNMRVTDYWTERNTWRWDLLSSLLPSSLRRNLEDTQL